MFFLRILITVFSLILLGACGSESKTAATAINSEGNNDANNNNPANPQRDCIPEGKDIQWQLLLDKNCENLADYQLFQQSDEPRHSPQMPGRLFELAIPLFTDYTNKYRFVFVPPGKKIQFTQREAFLFPVGSVLVKSFALPDASQNATGETLIETRLLIHRKKGWVALPYIWQKHGTPGAHALLTLEGKKISSRIIHRGAETVFDYQVPAIADCKTCHLRREPIAGNQGQTLSLFTPIGLKTRHLNRNIRLKNGEIINQLRHWHNSGLLEALPQDPQQLESIPQWGSAAADIKQLAKGYLDINCAHCHNPRGAGNESGMFLEYWREVAGTQHGICKRPGGFNGGARGLSFDIVPGDADQSILPYRMELLRRQGDAKGQVPPLARNLNHDEAIAIIKQWINSMPHQACR